MNYVQSDNFKIYNTLAIKPKYRYYYTKVAIYK